MAIEPADQPLTRAATAYFEYVRAAQAYHESRHEAASEADSALTEAPGASLHSVEPLAVRPADSVDRPSDARRSDALAVSLWFGTELDPLGPALSWEALARGGQDPHGREVVFECLQAMEVVEQVARRAKLLCDIHSSEDGGEGGMALTEDDLEVLREEMVEVLEDGCTRLCSYWDRAAQLLNFVFFNVREFDREVFATVLERLRKNYAASDDLFEQQEAWQSLWAYGNRRGESGFGWLSSRRNALMHSVLMPRYSLGDDLFAAVPGNNLGERLLSKVAPGSTSDELRRLDLHVLAMRDLHERVVDLCFFGLKTLKLRPWRLRPRID